VLWHGGEFCWVLVLYVEPEVGHPPKLSWLFSIAEWAHEV